MYKCYDLIYVNISENTYPGSCVGANVGNEEFHTP